MKRFLSSFIFLALFAASLFATEVTISSYTNANWQYGGSTARMVLYLDKQIVTTDNKVLNASLVGLGGWYKDISCTVTGTNLVCPSFTIDSTTDAQPNTAKYSVVFFDHRNTKRDIFAVIKVPPTPTPTTFGALIAYNAAPQRALPSTYYTSDQVNALFAAMIGSSARASDVIIGATKLSVPADSAETPIAVGTNDPRVAESSTTNRGTVKLDVSPASSSNPIAVGKNSYSSTTNNGVTALDTAPASASSPIAAGINSPQITKNTKVLYDDYSNSLSGAVSSIDSTPTTLIIKNNTTVSDDLTVPANVILQFENNAQISVASTKTLTINSMVDPGNVKLFTGAGTVVLQPRSVQYFNLTWWTGTDVTADATAGINAALANLSTNGGGSLYVPVGAWKTTGGHIVPSNTTIFGQSTRSDSVFSSSSFILTNLGSATFIMKASEAYRNIIIKDLGFNLSTSTLSNGFIAEGTYPNTATSLSFENVGWTGTGTGAPAQMFIKDLGSDWETLNISFTHCTWIVPTDGIGVRSTTINTGVIFVQPFFYVGVGGWATKFDRIANLLVLNPTINGISSVESDANTDPLARTLTGSISIGTKTLTITSTGSDVLNRNDVGQRIHMPNAYPDVGGEPVYTRITGITSSTTATVETNAVASATDKDIDIAYFTPSTEMAAGAFWLAGGRSNVTIIGAQDEGIQKFLQIDGSQQDYPIALYNNNIQSTIEINATCTITSSGNRYFSNTFTDAALAEGRIISTGDYVSKITRDFNDTGVGVTLLEARLFGVKNGGSIIQTGLNSYQGGYEQFMNLPLSIRHGEEFSASPQLTEPVLAVGSQFDKELLRLGRLDPVTNEFDYYYDLKRDASTGRLTFVGNQGDPYKGYDFNSDITANGIKSTGLGIGYTTGAGGTVTQTSSRTTAVSINKSSGAITLVSAAGSTSWASFTVNNSTVAATDTIVVSQKSGTDKYMIFVTAVGAGSFQITFATTSGTTTEQPVFNFNVIKGATS